MTDPAVGGGCAHHFCADCYEDWIKRKASCPTCRAPVWSITRDAEFARLIGAECSLSADVKLGGSATEPGVDESCASGPTGPRAIKIAAPAGLTISNSSHGCVVTRVVRGNGGDVAGIRVGDVILAVNGTEVREHRQCVEFIERRCRVGDCEVELKPRNAAVELLRRGSDALLRGLASPFRARPQRRATFPVLLQGAPASDDPSHEDTPSADDDTQVPPVPGSPMAAMALESPRGSPNTSPSNSRSNSPRLPPRAGAAYEAVRRTRISPLAGVVRHPTPLAAAR